MDIKFLKKSLFIIILSFAVYYIIPNNNSLTQEEIYANTILKLPTVVKINSILLSNSKVLSVIGINNPGTISNKRMKFSISWLLTKVKNKINKNDLSFLKNLNDNYKFMRLYINLNHEYIAYNVKRIVDEDVTHYFIIIKQKNIEVKPFSGPLLFRTIKKLDNNTFFVIEKYKHIGFLE